MAISYRDAGVDIDAGEELVRRIRSKARATHQPWVLDGIGGFAGLCALPGGIDDPVLVSGTDGVGTKLKVAFATGKHDTVGRDLVAMCVNDVVTTGARPLFFLDYFGCGKLDVDVAEQVVSGISEGCREADCALLGGETAELPGMYPDGEYDLAGFAVGVVSRSAILGRARVRAGDELIAVASSGLHSNGFSLARRILQNKLGLELTDRVPELGRTLGEALLVPTRIYARAVSKLLTTLGESLHGLSHITGGGLVDNVPRMLPHGTVGRLHLPREVPAIFRMIAEGGPVDADEMQRTFNLGIGMVAAVESGESPTAIAALQEAGERAWLLGEVAPTADGAGARVEIVVE